MMQSSSETEEEDDISGMSSTTNTPSVPWKILTLKYINSHSEDFTSEPLMHKAESTKKFKRICYRGESQNYIQCITCKTIIKFPLTNRPTLNIQHCCIELDAIKKKEEIAILQLQCVNDNLSFINYDQDGAFGILAKALIKYGSEMGKINVRDVLVNNEQLYSILMPDVIGYIKLRIKSILSNQKFALAINTWMTCTGNKYYTVSAQTLKSDFKVHSFVLGTAAVPENPADVGIKIIDILREYVISPNITQEIVVVEGHSEIFSGVNSRSKIVCPSYNMDIIINELKTIATENINKEDTKDPDQSYINFIEMFQKCSESLNHKSCVLSDIFLHKQKLESCCAFKNDDSDILVYLKSSALHMLETQFVVNDFHKMAVFLNPNFKGLKFLKLKEKIEIHELVKMYGIAIEKNSQKSKKPTSSVCQFNATSSIVNFSEMMDVHDSDYGQNLIDDEIMEYINFKMTSICTNTLEFWKKCSSFPKLKALVLEIFTVPATSYPCGKVFADGVNSRLRTCYLQDDIESMIFLNYNHELYDIKPSFE
ncbi:uncharacterized protein LOC143910229 [Arctopsyche grandis]|uniref:uncharacterized protein LOC143910229 n=1 Tax=Arctopsyche grandis TaxID=121162 RepID=UPI00406D80A5